MLARKSLQFVRKVVANFVLIFTLNSFVLSVLVQNFRFHILNKQKA